MENHETKTTNDDNLEQNHHRGFDEIIETYRNDQSNIENRLTDDNDDHLLTGSQSRGTKRPLVDVEEPSNCEDSDDWDPERDEFIRKIKEIKKLKAKDVRTDRMRAQSHRKSEKRWHYYMDERLETIKEFGEPPEGGGVGVGPAPHQDPVPPTPPPRRIPVPSKMQKTQSQIVRSRISVNVAKASPSPPASVPSRSIMYQRLQSEHLQLQRSFALLKQLVSESCGSQRENNANLSKLEEEKRVLLQTTKQLQNKVKDLQEKLNEYQEQNELLEFRILELDHCPDKGVTSLDVRDNGCNTDFCVNVASLGFVEDHHSPCFDSFEEQVARCQDLDIQVDSLQGELRKISSLPGLTCTQRKAIAHSASCVRKCKRELVSLWSRVNSLASRMEVGLDRNIVEVKGQTKTEEKMEQFLRSSRTAEVLDIEDIIKNLQKLESELNEEGEEETSMTESQIREMDSSKTESELDMSLTSLTPESEAPSLVHADNGGLCFDCTVAKEGVRNLTRRMKECTMVNHPHLEPRAQCAKPNSYEAGGNVTPSEDEGLGDDQSRRDGFSTGPPSLNDSESSAEERQRLQSHLLSLSRSLRLTEDMVSQLRTELNTKEEQISQLLSDNCPNRAAKTILELEERLSICETNRAELQEQVLELEEAENDARLESQNLRALVDNLKRNEADLDGQLDAARHGLDDYERQVMAMEVSDEELRTQINYLETLVFKYEEHVADLEKNETELRRRLMELEADKDEKNKVLIKDLRDAQVDAVVSKENRETQTENDAEMRSENSGNLLDRLLSLEAKDGQLRDQLHQMDSANLKLWRKLKDVDSDLDQCRKMDSMEVDSNERLPTERLDDLLLSIPPNVSEECLTPSTLSPSTTSTLERVDIKQTPDTLIRETKLRDRLKELENINRDFEKELGIREKLCRKKEMECREWAAKENKIVSKIESLRQEEESLLNRMNELESQKRDLENQVRIAEREKEEMVERHRLEVELAQQKHEKTVSELKTRLRELEDREESHSVQIKDLEKMDLTDKCGFDMDERQATVVKEQIATLKMEQSRLRTLIVRQTAETHEVARVFKEQLENVIRKHTIEEETYRQEIHTMKEREELYQLEIRELMEQRAALETELNSKREELDNVKRDFDKKMLLLEEEHHLVENELKWKLKEMEDGTNVAVRALEAKRKQLELSLQDDLKDLRMKEDSYKGRIKQLEKHVDTLRQEVTSIASSNYELDNQPMEIQRVAEDTFESDDQSLGERITELEKKEAAYLETLENADRIIHRLELNYKQKIDDLESTERSLRARLSQMEENEKMLKETLQIERKGADGWKVSDLVKELMDAETRENTLKDHADKIESSLKSLSQKAKELERTNRQLRDELREHDELLASLNAFKEKLEAAKEEIARLKQSESALKETLRQADSILVQREVGLLSKVDELEKEKREMNEILEQLRSEVKILNEKLETTQFEKSVLERSAAEHRNPSQLQQRVSELEAVESDLRLEVTRLRQCLSASNAHLSDLESVKRNQDSIIQVLEEEKTSAFKKIEEQAKLISNQTSVVKVENSVMSVRHIKECQEQMENQQTAQAFLLQRVAQLENALKYHQARLLSSNSNSNKVEDQNDLESPEVIEPVLPLQLPQTPIPMEEDDVFSAGIEERNKFEECVSRAMEAMERDLKESRNQSQSMSPTNRISISGEACLTSPNSPSTSGCESDAGSECCRSSNGEEGWESDHSESFSSPTAITRSKILNLPRKHVVVKSKELPTPVKTRVIYPTFSKTAVQEEAILFTGHSQNETNTATSGRIVFGDNPEPPNDFQILRQVGKDSLLVGWTPPVKFSRVQCYQIFVNDQLHQHVRSPDRTKALLHKLELASRSEPFSISIQTVSLDGRLSRPAAVIYDPLTFIPTPEKETVVTGHDVKV